MKLKTLVQVDALRAAWIAYRIRRVTTFMHRERALHRLHMAQLRAERDRLTLCLASAAQRRPAATIWKAQS